MAALESWMSVIGCLIMAESVLGEQFVCEFEHLRVEIFLVVVEALLKPFEKGRVFLVGEIVGRDVGG